MGVRQFALSAASVCLAASLVGANWDTAVGHLRDFTVKHEWLAKNKPVRTMSGIQVSECAKNTRLHYPDVQLFALFRVNHTADNYHGCPYGDCLAFTAAPGTNDVEPDFTNSHLFFWHNTGGLFGDGTKPISDPRSGAYGYEDSLSGKFISGPLDTSSEQPQHDNNYPGFDANKLPRWAPEELETFNYQKNLPMHPKCGRPCEPNRDPGAAADAYGHYKPADASAYIAPAGWKAGPNDNCQVNTFPGGAPPGYTGKPVVQGGKPGKTNESSHGQPTPTPPTVNVTAPPVTITSPKSPKSSHSSGHHCKNYCQCLKNCQSKNCQSCELNSNPQNCSQGDCGSRIRKYL